MLQLFKPSPSDRRSAHHTINLIDPIVLSRDMYVSADYLKLTHLLARESPEGPSATTYQQIDAKFEILASRSS